MPRNSTSSRAIVVFSLLAAGCAVSSTTELDDRSESNTGRIQQAATLSCASQTSLKKFFSCIHGAIIPRDTNDYVVPSATAIADYGNVVSQMMAGQCTGIVLP